jgi:hypothetical protein
MSDYLNRLVMRSLGQTMDIKPRPVSMFESQAISLDQSSSSAIDGETPFVMQVESLPKKHSTAPSSSSLPRKHSTSIVAPSPSSFEGAEPDSWADLPSSGSLESLVDPLDQSFSSTFDGENTFVTQVESLPKKLSTTPSPSSFEEVNPDSWAHLPSSKSIESHVNSLNSSAVQEYPSAYTRLSSTEVAPLKTDLSLPKVDVTFPGTPRHPQSTTRRQINRSFPTPWVRSPQNSEQLEQPIVDFSSSNSLKNYPRQIEITPQSSGKVFYPEAGGSHHTLVEDTESYPLTERRPVSQKLITNDDIELSNSSGRHDMNTNQEAHSPNSVIFQPPLARRNAR